MNQARAYHKSVALLDGSILAVSGNLSSAERYYPDNGSQTVTVRISSNLAFFTAVGGAGCSPGTYTSYPTLAINWTPGSSSQVSVSGSTGWSFSSWNDGSKANPRTFIAPNAPAAYSVTFTQSSSAPAAIQATGGTPQSATVDTAFASPLTATVTNSAGKAVSGVTVMFAPPASGASGTFAGGVNTAVTNPSGVATSASFTANATTGAYTIFANVAGIATRASFALTNVAGTGGISTTLVPSSYVTTAGTSSGQPVASSLDLLDESGTKDNWSKYVEFSGKYVGYQVFALPAGIAAGSVKSIHVQVNYRGPSTSSQTWTWQIYNWITASYVSVGTNAGATDWGAWKLLTFAVPGTLGNYIRSTDGQIRCQLLSNNSADAADIDYEGVIITQ